ncbi:MAG: hypothetical protein ABSG99_04395 [Sedimentisphaerales bacterium]
MIKRTGLTRIDLVVAVACAGFVLANAPVIVAGGRGRAKLEVCMANLRALTAAWSMYADSNGDKIVNGAAGTPRPGEPAWVGKCWNDGYMEGKLLPVADQIEAIKAGALWPYLKNIGLYKCPSGYRGEMLTYSITDAMNGYPRNATKDLVIKSRTQIPRPQDRMVFVDEGWATPDSYAVFYNTERWWDSPPVRHGDGATFSFADGHSEYWKWSQETVDIGKHLQNNANPVTPDGKEDLYRVQKAVWGKLGYTPSVPP